MGFAAQLLKSSVPLSPPSWIFFLHDAPVKQPVSWRTPPVPPTVSSSSYHQETVPEHQSPLRQTAQQLFPQAVRALNSTHTAPLWNPIQTPTSWNMDHHPPTPKPYHITEKNSKTFLCNSNSATHRWVGLYKLVVTHSPLLALFYVHTFVCT